MGNPIVKNDRIGHLIGRRLEDEFRSAPDLEVREFTGSPLDLVSELAGCRRVIFVDAVACGAEPGSVIVFDDADLLAPDAGFYPHGLNFREAITLFRKLDVPLPEKMILIGIEVGEIDEFGETLSAELEGKLDEIYGRVLQIVRRFLREST